MLHRQQNGLEIKTNGGRELRTRNLGAGSGATATATVCLTTGIADFPAFPRLFRRFRSPISQHYAGLAETLRPRSTCL